MRQVFIAPDSPTAHLLKGLLEAEGIEAVVLGEGGVLGAGGEVPMTEQGLLSVWVVNDADFERALKLAWEFWRREGRGQSEGKRWRCRKCGEMHGPQFTDCWKCGASRVVKR